MAGERHTERAIDLLLMDLQRERHLAFQGASASSQSFLPLPKPKFQLEVGLLLLSLDGYLAKALSCHLSPIQ